MTHGHTNIKRTTHLPHLSTDFTTSSRTKSNIYKILHLPTVPFGSIYSSITKSVAGSQYNWNVAHSPKSFGLTWLSQANATHTSKNDSVQIIIGKWKLVPVTTNVNAWEEPDGSNAVFIVFQYEGHLDRGGGGLRRKLQSSLVLFSIAEWINRTFKIQLATGNNTKRNAIFLLRPVWPSAHQPHLSFKR
jgi:hypothetical protein